MSLLKLDRRYLNLEHITLVAVSDDGIEVVTPYEVLRLDGADAETVLLAVERLAAQTQHRLKLPIST